jgi:cell division protein FtsN
MSRLALGLFSLFAGLFVSFAYAQEAETPKVEVNQTQWSQLSDEEKAQVEQALSQSFPGQRFALAPSSGAAVAAIPKPTGPQCKLVCQVGGAVAGAACPLLPPVAAAICLAAAPEVQKICDGACNKIPQ